MDLTKEYPRSVREKSLGIVQLARTIDKAKAVAHGNVGEYNYDCPMDRALFEFLNVSGGDFLEIVRTAKNDDEIERRIAPIVQRKTAGEIERWNGEWLKYAPNERTREFFESARAKIAPERSDVTTWTDLLDLDEGREVPVRVGV
ncbi:MAG: DUF5069 domain-containing protein [Candidatus Tyrphobacter sp.]